MVEDSKMEKALGIHEDQVLRTGPADVEVEEEETPESN